MMIDNDGLPTSYEIHQRKLDEYEKLLKTLELQPDPMRFAWDEVLRRNGIDAAEVSRNKADIRYEIFRVTGNPAKLPKPLRDFLASLYPQREVDIESINFSQQTRGYGANAPEALLQAHMQVVRIGPVLPIEREGGREGIIIKDHAIDQLSVVGQQVMFTQNPEQVWKCGVYKADSFLEWKRHPLQANRYISVNVDSAVSVALGRLMIPPPISPLSSTKNAPIRNLVITPHF